MSWSPRHFLTLPFDTINRCKFLASEKFLQIPNMKIWRSQVRNVWWIGKTLPCPMPCTVEVMWAAHILILLHSSTTTQVKRPGLQHETALLKCPTGDCSYHHTTWHEINENGFVNVPKVCCHHPSHDHTCFQLPLFSQHGILPYHCIHFWTVVAQTCLTTGDDMWQKVFNCSLMILEAGQTGGHSVTPLLVGQLFQHPSAALCKIKEFHRQYPIYCNVRGWISVLAALVIGMSPHAPIHHCHWQNCVMVMISHFCPCPWQHYCKVTVQFLHLLDEHHMCNIHGHNLSAHIHGLHVLCPQVSDNNMHIFPFPLIL